MARAACSLILATALACSSGTSRIGGQPSWRGKRVEAKVQVAAPAVFAPASVAASRYNEPLVSPPASALGDLAIAAVSDAATRAGLPAPAADARLFRACEELAQVVPEEGIVGYAVVEFALQRQGIVEPSPHLLVVWGNIDEPRLIVDQLRPRLAEILADGASARLGIGAARRAPDGTGAVVFALQGSGVTTAPIPRAVPAGGAFSVDAVVAPRFRDPELIVTRGSGATEVIPVRLGRAGAFEATVACGDHLGRQQVEITAIDPSGTTVLANFPVWCGEAPPTSIALAPAEPDAAVVAADEAERRLLALVNRDRLAAGLSALLWDDRLAAVSRAHSEDMRTTKLVAHISTTTGSAADRVKAVGIKTALVLENVARAYGVGEAHAGLMNSPGHRANLLSPAATHLGIGVVLGDEVSGRREMFVTQVFVRVPPRLDPAQGAALVGQRLDAARRVRLDPRLADVAQGVADGLAAGRTRESMWPLVKRQLDAIEPPYARVGSVVVAVADLDAIDGGELIGDYRPDDVGVGLAQGSHPQIGEGAVWVVVLLAERQPGAR